MAIEDFGSIIAEVERGLDVSAAAYPCPEAGSVGFRKTVDHTLLKLDAKEEQFDALCEEARENGFATVCVRPEHVARCASQLKGNGVKVASVIGFHEGTHDLKHKSEETTTSLAAGATEFDIVLNYPQLQRSQYDTIAAELAHLRAQAPPPTILKLILETSQLSRAQIVAACTLAAHAELDFVKTSTGFNGPGASEENVRLMRACCERLVAMGKKRMQVKASGGVRSLADAVKMLRAGAARLGTSAGVQIAVEAAEVVRSGGDISRKVDEGAVGEY